MKLNITINFYVGNVRNLEKNAINPSIYVEDSYNKSQLKNQLATSNQLLAKNNKVVVKLNPKSESDCDCCQNTAIYYSPDGSNKFCILHQPNI